MNKVIFSWEKLTLGANSSIGDAISILNQTGVKIVLVISDKGFLEGTISDGDIRRGFLRGIGFEDSIELILHKNPLVAPPNMKREMVLQLMAANKIQQIPIVDSMNKVLGIHLWNEISSRPSRSNTMVIMAGGMGTRLRPETDKVPKPLLHVNGKPILEHIIEKAKLEGFSHFVLAVHYLKEMIQEYFKNGSNLGVDINYINEIKPLGTVGALSMFDIPPEDDFIVTNGDVITEIHYAELLDFHKLHSSIATMAVRRHEIHNPFGVVETSGIEIIGYEEKPISISNINAGVYALSPTALSFLPKMEPCSMPELFEKLRSKSLKTIAYPIHEQWMDIGYSVDLTKANSDAKSNQRNNHYDKE